MKYFYAIIAIVLLFSAASEWIDSAEGICIDDPFCLACEAGCVPSAVLPHVQAIVGVDTVDAPYVNATSCSLAVVEYGFQNPRPDGRVVDWASPPVNPTAWRAPYSKPEFATVLIDSALTYRLFVHDGKNVDPLPTNSFVVGTASARAEDVEAARDMCAFILSDVFGEEWDTGTSWKFGTVQPGIVSPDSLHIVVFDLILSKGD